MVISVWAPICGHFTDRLLYFALSVTHPPNSETDKPAAKAAAQLKQAAPSHIETSLQEVNRRLQSIQITNEVATWTWDIANNRMVADKNMARLFGLSSEAAAGGPVENYLLAIHPDDRNSVQEAINKALAGPNNRYEMTYRIARSDGGISWVIARGTVERDTDGKPKYFPGVVIDISELKASEEKASELRFRLEQQSRILDITLSSISDFAYIFDREGRFAFVNQALLNLWGLQLEEALGKNFFDLKYPETLAARLQQQIQRVFDTKEGLTDETEYRSPTGAGGYYEYIFRPVFDREGHVELVAGSTRDITERKQAEAELRESQQSLRRLADSLEQQVQIRTKDVLLQSEQLRELSVRLMRTQDEERRRIAREMHDSAGQMVAALSMNLSSLARKLGDAGPALVQLANEAQNLVKELGQDIRTTSYLLHPPMLDELGLREALSWYVEGLQQRAGIEVRLSMAKIERLSNDIELTIFRVVQECLTNIHRHSGSKSAHIEIVSEPEKIVVVVRDFGKGIGEEALATIRNRGAGVGFRGMRERVRPFAGEVRIDSEAGVGTTITVTLPYSRPN